MTKKLLLIGGVIAYTLCFSACKPNEPEDPNEEELITTVKYTLTPVGGGTSITLSYKDLDGDGGVAATITGGTLAANKTYNGTIELLNEAESPAENITTEVSAEAADHQFFYKSTAANLNIAYADADANGKPLGVASTLTTGAATSGNLTITLRHEPNKSATGVASGDITNAGGETDIEVALPVSVQ